MPSDPNSGYPPQPPVSGGGYAPPPSSGGGAYAPPPTSGGGYQQPGYQQPGYQQQQPGGYQQQQPGGYQQPGYQQPGYQQPGNAYGQYQQPGAYGAPGAPGMGPAPVGYVNNDEKTWALIAHFGPILVGFIAPLVAMLAKGNESPTVRAHSVEALNFHITWGIAIFVGALLSVCTFGLTLIAPWIVAVVFSIIGGMKANNGELYRYPMSIRMVK
jgi:uncharacterized Tic20 family protein